MVFSLPGCDLGPTLYTLTMVAEGEGTVTPKEGTHSYEEDTVVSLKAQPEEGWKFTAWEGGVKDPNDPETDVLLDKDKVVKAVFRSIPKPQYTLTITIKGEGEGTVTPREGTHTYEEGTVVQIEAVPKEGRCFSHWEGDYEGVHPFLEIVMDGDISIQAFFSFFAGGIGALGDPYLIETPGQLFNIRNHLGRHFQLVNDIDLTRYSSEKGWLPIGTQEDPFLGTIDGNSYGIYNLYIERTHTSGVGLFGYIGGDGHILDMTILDAQVTGSSYVGILAGMNAGKIENSDTMGIVEGERSVGGLVGKNKSTGTVKGSYFLGSVTGITNTGGLVGFNENSIQKSYAINGSVTGSKSNIGGLTGINKGDLDQSFAIMEVSGYRAVGGLIGTNQDQGSILNTYARGDVQGEMGVGGLVGDNRGLIKNCYAVGQVESSTDRLGGLVGDVGARSSIESSYYDRETSGCTDEGKGKPRTTEEMMQVETFVDWDFMEIWGMTPGETYPFFLWQ